MYDVALKKKLRLLESFGCTKALQLSAYKEADTVFEIP